MSRANPPATFWRCKQCGTPNPHAGYLTNCPGCGTLRSTDEPATPAEPADRPRAKREPRRRVRLGLFAVAACWTFAAVLAGLVAVLRLTGDCWWPMTFVLFGPRWVAVLPMAVLVPLAVLSRRRATLWPLLIASTLLVGPWMGLCLSWQTLQGDGPTGALKVRVLTCNVQGGQAVGLLDLVASSSPDVVVMQEISTDGAWSSALFREPEWYVRNVNGVGVASRFPIVGVEAHSLAEPVEAGGTIGRFELSTPVGRLDVFGVHLATPREGLEAVMSDRWAGVAKLQANLVQRLRESQDASRWVAKSTAPYLVAGDFNMPADSTIYQQCWSSFTNVFSGAGFGFGHSKFTRWFGIRIDHILTGPGWRLRDCRVGPDVGSDHRPVIADVEWSPPVN